MTAVIPPDIELWLTTYIRTRLKRDTVMVEVSNKEPATLATPLKRPLIIVRNDGQSTKSRISYDATVGVNVLGGTAQDDQATMDLARKVFAILTDDVELLLPSGSPIADIDYGSCLAPTHVTDAQNVTRTYMSLAYTTVGTW